jgi:hypothetical protein
MKVCRRWQWWTIANPTEAGLTPKDYVEVRYKDSRDRIHMNLGMAQRILNLDVIMWKAYR